jgi:flagellar biosynthesis anti-sigma factor FlgM
MQIWKSFQEDAANTVPELTFHEPSEGRAQVKAGTAEQVQLDEEVRHLPELAASSDARTERIEAIRAALAGGIYGVSAYDLAGKLITYLLKR